MKHFEEARADKGINFGADIKTIDHYGLFLKSSTSVIGPGEPVPLPAIDRRVDHEVEVAAIVGRECYQVAREQALDMICGYTIALDMSVRGPEDRSWRKSYDTFSVLGPWLVTADEIAVVGNLELSLAVNGEERQRSSTKALIFDVRPAGRLRVAGLSALSGRRDHDGNAGAGWAGRGACASSASQNRALPSWHPVRMILLTGLKATAKTLPGGSRSEPDGREWVRSQNRFAPSTPQMSNRDGIRAEGESRDLLRE